jgi:Protein of unknown function (DUF3800)
MATLPHKQKLYCFVDETGQDTKGELFLVSVIVTAEEYDRVNQVLLEIEQQSKKGLGKWHKTKYQFRVSYIEQVLAHPIFPDTVFFSHYTETQAYFDLTVETTAKAVLHKASSEYTTTVTVDGLSGRDVNRFKRRLRELRVNVRKVRGARDESEPLVRLADAIAGFVRDYLEGQEYAQALFQKAHTAGVIREL